jgi:tetratricopeptide (TPR) repeat protein
LTVLPPVAIFAALMRLVPFLAVAGIVLTIAPPALADRSLEADRAFRQAQSLIEQGLQGAALEPLRTARDLAPDDLVIHCEYQDLMTAQGFGVDLVEEYEARAARAPDDADALYLYGRSTGDPSLADTWFDKAIAVDDHHVWAIQGKGGVAAVEGRLDEALEWYARALAIDPTRADVYNKQAGIHYARGDYEGAMTAWKAALEHAPNDYHAYMNMGAVLSLQGDLERAEVLLAGAVERAPGNPLAYVNRAYVLLKLQRYEESIAGFYAALAINPRDRKVAGSLEFVQKLQSGEIPFEAFGPYEQALAASVRDPRAAVQHFREVVLLAPDFAVAHMNLGLIQVSIGDFDEGMVALRKAVELAPDNVAARYNLGFALLGTRQLLDALTQLLKARELDPGDVDVLSALGLAQLGLGDVSASIATHRKALELQPRDPVLWLQMATAQKELGDLGAAERSVRKALEIAPGFATARIQLVAILRQDRQFDQALAELKPLEELAPDHPDIAAEKAALESGRAVMREAAAGGKIRLSQIMTRDAAVAEEVLRKLTSGGSFGMLASRYGTGPEAGRSGDIGYVDAEELRAEVSAAVRGLAVGDRTGVVDLGSVHLILLRTE